MMAVGMPRVFNAMPELLRLRGRTLDVALSHPPNVGVWTFRMKLIGDDLA